MEAKVIAKQQEQLKVKQNKNLYWIGGVAFTFLIAFFGYTIALLPGFNRIGQMATAILIAILYRQIFGYPELLRAGITFSSKILLRLAIVLYGLKLNIAIIIGEGMSLILAGTGVILFAILGTWWLAKLFKADANISLLAGVGTGVCGAAAIAAVAPVVKSKEKDTALGVAMIALTGTVISIIYTLLRPVLPLTDLQYGIWSGLTLHELAHVALAAAPAGEDATAMALLAKLGRVFLLVPLSFILLALMNRNKQSGGAKRTKIDFPWFLLGFIAMSLFGTYILGHYIPVNAEIMNGVSTGTTWLLTAAMVGLGLNVSLKDIRTRALRPFIAMLIISVLLSVIGFFVVQLI